MQLFICFEKKTDGTSRIKEVMANSRYDASMKTGVPMKDVQLQTRTH